MTAFAFIGVAVTSATIVLFGEAIWDPVVLIARIGGTGVIVFAALVVLAAQLTTNMAANVVSPSNDFSNLSPQADQLRDRRAHHRGDRHPDDAVEALLRRRGLHLHLAAGLLEPDGRAGRDPDRRLLGRSGASGSMLDDLYREQGAYTYRNGVNSRAVAAFVDRHPAGGAGLRAGGGDARAGRWRIPNFFDRLYSYAWFVTFGLSFVAYLVLMRGDRPTPPVPTADHGDTEATEDTQSSVVYCSPSAFLRESP